MVIMMFIPHLHCGVLVFTAASPATRRLLFLRAGISDALMFAQKSRSRARHPQKINVSYRFSIKNIQGLASIVLFVRGVVAETTALA